MLLFHSENMEVIASNVPTTDKTDISKELPLNQDDKEDAFKKEENMGFLMNSKDKSSEGRDAVSGNTLLLLFALYQQCLLLAIFRGGYINETFFFSNYFDEDINKE